MRAVLTKARSRALPPIAAAEPARISSCSATATTREKEASIIPAIHHELVQENPQRAKRRHAAKNRRRRRSGTSPPLLEPFRPTAALAIFGVVRRRPSPEGSGGKAGRRAFSVGQAGSHHPCHQTMQKVPLTWAPLHKRRTTQYCCLHTLVVLDFFSG